MSDPLLEVVSLSKHFPRKTGFFDAGRGTLRAVDGVSFSVRRGETFGLVGESGCGKTTTGRMVLRVLEPTSGEIRFSHRGAPAVDLARLSQRQLRPLRRHLQLIFQDPYASLDPRMTVFQIVAEPLRAALGLRRRACADRVAAMLETVGLRPEHMSRYPHSFSGGQRQRIGIARALVTDPEFVVADEPVSALDVSVQAQILNLLQDLRERLSLTYLFISHDMGVVRHVCDVVGVMYRGRLVEVGPRQALFGCPAHPYTEALLAAVPALGRPRPRSVPLAAPAAAAMSEGAGCAFRDRCLHRHERCEREVPALRPLASRRSVACHLDLRLEGA